MTSPINPANPGPYLKQDSPPTGSSGGLRGLWHCVRVLGPFLGWRYWAANRRAVEDPTSVRQWAFNCRVEANSSEWRGEDQAAAFLRKWAGELDSRVLRREG
jgi:hypothetical protein